ncbi:MAG: DNA-binding protein WhiA [Clostridiales bacterium]|nr:DNA-binding protein WhiA [Clostridiales bacterium]
MSARDGGFGRRSHTWEIDEYLSSHCKKNVKKPCCRDALMYGLLLFSSGHTGDVSAELLEWLIRQNEKQKRTFIIDGFGAVDEAFFVCPECRRAFLCGAFLACGTVSDPKKSYRLELSVVPGESGHELSVSLARIMDELGFKPLTTERGGCDVLYLRSSETVEDFLGFIGAAPAAFEAMNARIYKEFRNNANRVANCETSNIGRAVTAAQKQIAAIRSLEASGRLALLPEQLRDTARLRIEYPSASLTELAGLHDPPITKSGCVHRLKKLAEAAEEEPD